MGRPNPTRIAEGDGHEAGVSLRGEGRPSGAALFRAVYNAPDKLVLRGMET